MDNNRMVEAASVLRTEADEERMQRLQEYSRQLAVTVRAGEVDDIRQETGSSIDALFREEFKC